MRIGRYLQDRRVMITLFVAALVVSVVFMAACGVGTELIGVVSVVMSVATLIGLIYDYCRKNAYYRRLFQNLDRMDQKYLILETLRQPGFYEGELFAQVLYEANKSMTEQVNENRRQMKDLLKCGCMRGSFRWQAFCSCVTITRRIWIKSL